jgi:soluble lytic murein transglycosylase-like protein
VIRCVVIMLAALMASQAACASFICTDEWGRSYSLTQPMSGDLLSKFKCRPTEPAPPAAPVPLSAAENLSRITAALGLPQPQAVTPKGALSLAVIRTPAAPPEMPDTPLGDQALHALIDSVARRHGHDASLLRAIVHVESRFNPRAVSPKGAIGLMQVMPATGRRVGVSDPQRTLFDPESNLDAGARYLQILVDMFPKRLDLAIAAYNAGEGAVIRYKRSIPPYPETQSYVRQVLAQYSRYRQQ